MKRLVAGAMGLVVAVALWTAPAMAQDKYTLGMTGGT